MLKCSQGASTSRLRGASLDSASVSHFAANCHRIHTFQKQFTLLGTAPELILVQNVGDNIQLFLMQVHKLLFRLEECPG